MTTPQRLHATRPSASYIGGWSSGARDAAESTATALLVGDEPRIVINVARSLYRHGVRVVAAISAGAPPLRSRAIAGLHRLPDWREGTAARANALVAIAAREPEVVLVPCTDTALTIVEQHEAVLRGAMRIASPSAPVVRSVLEKNLTLDVARQCGVEVPQEYVLPSRVHLHDARDDLQFPLVAKPRDKTCEADFKVRYYHEFSEIDEAFARDDSFGARHLLQRYVPGEGVLVGVVMDHSTAVAVVQHRRITELPATGGVSVLAETEPVHPKAERDSVALLDALGWHGVAAVEFRHDRATDRWVLMEVNGRFWGQHVITQHAGIDFPWLAWRLAHGETITERYTARTGVRTLWLAGDLRRAHGLAHASTAAPDRPSAVRGIRDLLVDLAAAHHTALGDWSDPRPLIDEITRTVRTIVMDETKQIARALLPRHAWSALRAIRRGPPPTHT